MPIDITEIVVAVIGLCSVIVTVKVIPYVKAKTSKENLEKAAMWTDIAVHAAEQAYKKNEIKAEERFEKVRSFLEKKGITVDFDEIETLIEGLVNKLPEHLTIEASSIKDFNTPEDKSESKKE